MVCRFCTPNSSWVVPQRSAVGQINKMVGYLFFLASAEIPLCRRVREAKNQLCLALFCLSQNEMGHNGSKCLKKHTGSFNNIFQNFRRVIQYWLVRGGWRILGERECGHCLLAFELLRIDTFVQYILVKGGICTLCPHVPLKYAPGLRAWPAHAIKCTLS